MAEGGPATGRGARGRRAGLHPAWLGAAAAGGALLTVLLLWGTGRLPSPGAEAPAAPLLAEQVRAAILANPEIIPEAINRLQEREVERLLASNRQRIETPHEGAWAGAEDGDVVLVEFFDYACPFCSQSVADVERLLAEDSRLKVVFRDMPVLGPDSERYARAGLVAAAQGPERYRAFHAAVFQGKGPLSQERLIRAVRQARLNEGAVARGLEGDAVDAAVTENLELGRALGLTGTPSYVVGNQILSGAVGYEALKEAIAKARAEAGRTSATPA